ncbi:caffeic acid O-methyltransferase [Striga asiatica]|uniref:Caffeic acid O-methyltransferase n=1 Tax=Striga asiatica TaxID=4170 RepID=A0A5A7PFW0_STRAF|nr:caffeic acid O-methyltransferase [Striga asiatica]
MAEPFSCHETFFFAMQLASAFVLPMVLKSAIELNLLELIWRADMIKIARLDAQFCLKGYEDCLLDDRLLQGCLDTSFLATISVQQDRLEVDIHMELKNKEQMNFQFNKVCLVFLVSKSNPCCPCTCVLVAPSVPAACCSRAGLARVTCTSRASPAAHAFSSSGSPSVHNAQRAHASSTPVRVRLPAHACAQHASRTRLAHPVFCASHLVPWPPPLGLPPFTCIPKPPMERLSRGVLGSRPLDVLGGQNLHSHHDGGAWFSPMNLAAQLPTANSEASVMLDRILCLLVRYSILNCRLRALSDSGTTWKSIFFV